jgi:hypothetical protein
MLHTYNDSSIQKKTTKPLRASQIEKARGFSFFEVTGAVDVG